MTLVVLRFLLRIRILMLPSASLLIEEEGPTCLLFQKEMSFAPGRARQILQLFASPVRQW